MPSTNQSPAAATGQNVTSAPLSSAAGYFFPTVNEETEEERSRLENQKLSSLFPVVSTGTDRATFSLTLSPEISQHAWFPVGQITQENNRKLTNALHAPQTKPQQSHKISRSVTSQQKINDKSDEIWPCRNDASST